MICKNLCQSSDGLYFSLVVIVNYYCPVTKLKLKGWGCTLLQRFVAELKFNVCIPMQVHNKQYRDEVEELNQLGIWQENKAYVEAHNAAAELHGFTLELNKFSDLTNSEFVKTYNGYQMKEPSTPSSCACSRPSLPTTIICRLVR